MDMGETVASSSKIEVSPPKKPRQLNLGHSSIPKKQAIINMYKKILDDHPGVKRVELVFKVETTLSVAKSTVYRIIKEYNHLGRYQLPKTWVDGPGIIANFGEIMKNSVRRVEHSFFFKNGITTMDKILPVLKTRQDLPQISRSSLYKFMKQINFKFGNTAK